MPKLSELITSLCKKVGFDLTDAKYADILAITQEVPAELFDAVDKGLMSEDAAVNNKQIRAKLKAEAYNGIDKDIETLLGDFELEDDIRTGILSEKKSVDRFKKLASHLKEQSEKAAKAGDKSQASALQKQVDDLNKTIRDIKAAHKTETDQLKADNESSIVGFGLRSLLGTRQFSLPDAMKPDAQVEMVYGEIDRELKEKGLKVIRENGKLRLLNADGTDPYNEKNEKLFLDNFLDGALAQRGLIKVSDPNKGGDSGKGDQTPPNKIPGGAATPTAAVESALAEIDRRLAEPTD